MNPRILPTALIAALSIALPATAADRPLLFPRHDVRATYAISGTAKDLPPTATLSIDAGAHHVRIEGAGRSEALLIDRAAGRAKVVVPGSGVGFDVPMERSIDGYLADPSAKFVRQGEGTVAGLPCTNWSMRSAEAEGTGCITADGVILRVDGRDRHGHTLTATATQVSRAPIPAATFAAPESSVDLGGIMRSFGGR